jgi:hypothetical protein
MSKVVSVRVQTLGGNDNCNEFFQDLMQVLICYEFLFRKRKIVLTAHMNFYYNKSHFVIS